MSNSYIPRALFGLQLLVAGFVAAIVAPRAGLPVASSLLLGAFVNIMLHWSFAKAMFRWPAMVRFTGVMVKGMYVAECLKLLCGGLSLALLACQSALVPWAVFVGYLIPVAILWLAILYPPCLKTAA